MWKIRKFSLQSGFELVTTRLIDQVITNWTTEAGYGYFNPSLEVSQKLLGVSEIINNSTFLL